MTEVWPTAILAGGHQLLQFGRAAVPGESLQPVPLDLLAAAGISSVHRCGTG